MLQAGISQAYISYRHVSLASVHLTGVHLKGRRTFIPIEQTTQPAGVLCSMGWGDQVPLNGSASTPQPSLCLGAISPQFVPPDTSRQWAFTRPIIPSSKRPRNTLLSRFSERQCPGHLAKLNSFIVDTGTINTGSGSSSLILKPNILPASGIARKQQ